MAHTERLVRFRPRGYGEEMFALLCVAVVRTIGFWHVGVPLLVALVLAAFVAFAWVTK